MSETESCLVRKSDIEPFTKPLKKIIKQLQADLDTAKREIVTLNAEVTIQKSVAEIAKHKQIQFQNTALKHIGNAQRNLATAKAENEDLCDNVDAIRQDMADMRAGTLAGKLQTRLNTVAKLLIEGKRIVKGLNQERHNLRAENERLKEVKGTCTWRFREPFDGDEAWNAECGAWYTFIEGGLEDNGVKYCQKCGRLIKEVRPDKESDK